MALVKSEDPFHFWPDLLARTRRAALTLGLPVVGVALLCVLLTIAWNSTVTASANGLLAWFFVLSFVLGLGLAALVRSRTARPAWSLDTALAVGSVAVLGLGIPLIAAPVLSYALGSLLLDFATTRLIAPAPRQ